MRVEIRDSESFEQLLRRFPKGIERSGIIREHRRGLRFISVQEENRAKRRKAEHPLEADKEREADGGRRVAGGVLLSEPDDYIGSLAEDEEGRPEDRRH